MLRHFSSAGPLFVGLLLLFSLSQCNTVRRLTAEPRVDTTRPGGPVDARLNRTQRDVVDLARNQLGSRYKYAGNNAREGFDCSGLVAYVFREQGISVDRTSSTQARNGQAVDLQYLQPGDLVYFARSKGGNVFHIAIVTEVDRDLIQVVHSTSSRGVIEENLLASSYWKPKIAGARRLIGK